MHVNLTALTLILAVSTVIVCAFSATLPLLFAVVAIALAAHSVVDAQRAEIPRTDAITIRQGCK